MRKQKLLSGLLASLMVASQFGWVGVVTAEDHSPSPAPSPTAEASPSPSPAPSPEPSPSASPSPEPSPTPVPSPEPSASPSPSPSPAPTPETGPGGCGGVVPNWVFDTVSRTWVAADKGSFTCDMASGYYMSPKYVFNKRSGWYQIMPVNAPLPDYIISVPNVVHTVLGDLTVGSADYKMAQALGLLNPTDGIVLSGSPAAATTGPGAGTEVAANTNNQTWFDLTNLVNVINILQSNATSGNVAASSNTQVGDTSTGAAMVVANLINLLASAWSWSSGNMSFFTQTINDFNKDIHLGLTESATGGGGNLGGTTGATDVSNNASLDVNVQNEANIVNDIDLTAQSGDASATSNTAAGNVSTGAAMAEVNIMNLINSFILSGSSFFGILNIMGNLNGDILFPEGFLDGLVPSGSSSAATSAVTGPGSTTAASTSNDLQATINNTTTNSVSNNIQANAASGAVAAEGNGTTGGLNSGTATTSNNTFNLSNSSIFGDNAVLVMVNVMGHWVGKIMNLAGNGTSQAALLTGNATVSPTAATGPSASTATNVDNTTNVNVDQQTAGTITNNVNLTANSGDATASDNTSVGNVSSGNAQTASNVANIFNTAVNVKHWFGVLVINVFGSWMGDMNHDSAAGGFSTTAEAAPAGTPAATAASAAAAPHMSALPAVGLLALVKPVNNGALRAAAGGDASAHVSQGNPQVLTAAATTPQTTLAAAKAKNMSFMFIVSAIIMLMAGALITIERKLSRK